jgi:hypothetical protein
VQRIDLGLARELCQETLSFALLGNCSRRSFWTYLPWVANADWSNIAGVGRFHGQAATLMCKLATCGPTVDGLGTNTAGLFPTLVDMLLVVVNQL